MDRLLSEQEQAGLIWELSATIEGSGGRQPTQEEVHDYLLKAQDDLTAHLVAQEMISKFNVIYYYGTCVHPAIREDEEVYIIRKQDWEAIKSRWVKE